MLLFIPSMPLNEVRLQKSEFLINSFVVFDVAAYSDHKLREDDTSICIL